MSAPDSGAVDAGSLAPLTPRPLRRFGRGRRWTAGLIAAAAAVAVALLIGNLLGDAALFFYNVDEAVERRAELGSQRFRVQGTPLGEPATVFRDDRPVLAFSIGFEGAVIDVVHAGDPPDLFQPGVPVVLEGSWRAGPSPAGTAAEDAAGSAGREPGDGWHFASDRMLVKHDNDYRSRDDYDQRIAEADRAVAPQ